MSDYRFCVSLRITHPNINPNEITNALGIKPSHTRMIGEKRTTPKGQALDSINKESFWRAELHDDKNLFSQNISLEDFLASQNARLSNNAAYFAKIVSEGGYVEYFVGWFADGQLGATLEPSLLKSTAELSISIGLDIYAGKE